MTSFKEAQVKKIAHLAKLRLTDDELKAFTPQVKKILDYVDLLMAVDVEGVEPLIHPHETPLQKREDKVVSFSDAKSDGSKILKNAPDVLNDGFKVPPIL